MTTDTSRWCPRRWHEIIPNLWQGGHYYDARGARGITAAVIHRDDKFDLVVSLYRRAGHGPIDGTPELHLTIPDGPLTPAALDKVRDLADTVADAVRKGRKTLVRCQAGLNRSGLVVGFALCQLGYTPDQAIELVRAKRSPHALFNVDFVNYLTGGVM